MSVLPLEIARKKLDLGLVPGKEQSKVSGGTAEELPMERKKATFDIEVMTNCLDGGKDQTARRRFFQRGTLEYQPFIVRNVDRFEVMEEHYRHFTELHKEAVAPESKFKLQPNDFKFMFESRVLNGALSTHHSLFISTVRSQASDEQLGWWLNKCLRQEIIGCYAQTEIGIGSNVRGIQTTATYDEASDSFILDTPTLTATKFWNTGLPSCTHVVLYAQLVIKNKSHGIHVFFVQIRGANLEPLPGVEILDVGTKMGDSQADIGALRLHNVKIPRVHMLARRQYVDRQGNYVKVGSGGKSESKMAYLTMLQTRAGMVSASGAVLAEAATIAIRYSAVRKQGFVEPSKADFKSGQNKIIDYPIQRHRLLKALSTSVVIKAAGMQMIAMMGRASMDDLTELHATSSILKAHCTTLASHGIEQMRKCCGGMGYLSAGGLSELFCWWVGPYETAEGDPTVLTLQTARFLIKSYQTARKGEQLPMLTSLLARLRDPAFDPLRQGRSPKATADAIGQADLQAILSLFEYRSLVATHAAGTQFEQAMKRNNNNFDRSWTECMRILHAAATVHGVYFMVRVAIDWASQTKDEACRMVLERLVAYHALSEMEDGYQWNGLLSFEDSRAIESALNTLAGKLRNDMVSMVDAFDIADATLNSVLGRKDGNVYEALFESVVKSPLNLNPDGSRITVPKSLRVLAPHLDKTFLARGNTPVIEAKL